MGKQMISVFCFSQSLFKIFSLTSVSFVVIEGKCALSKYMPPFYRLEMKIFMIKITGKFNILFNFE